MKKLAAALFLVVVLWGCRHPGEVSDSGKRAPVKGWYDLAIGQTMDVSSRSDVLRVPGGWVYRIFTGYRPAVCFIPYSEEGLR